MYIKLYNRLSNGIGDPYRHEIVECLSEGEYVYTTAYGNAYGVHVVDELCSSPYGEANAYLMIIKLSDIDNISKWNIKPGPDLMLIKSYIEQALLNAFINKLN